MAASPDRLVQRMQRRLLSVGRPGHITPREVAFLENRVRRLRALSDRFDHVRLSPFVAACAATDVLDRVGGECVATEV